MKLNDIIARVAEIEIKTRRMLAGHAAGDFRTQRIGSGYDFHQLREYQQGDDIRHIDFKSSARTQKILVREYLEDRNRTIYIAVDISASTHYGSSNMLKSSVMHEIALILACSAQRSKDEVGLILFSDTIEQVVPPRASRAQFLRIAQELMNHIPRSKKSDLRPLFSFLLAQKRKKSMVFVISDFMMPIDTHALKLASTYHELLAIRCYDQRESDFALIGLLSFRDLETSEDVMIDTSKRSCNEALKNYEDGIREQLRNAQIDVCDIPVHQDYTKKLIRFLSYRNGM